MQEHAYINFFLIFIFFGVQLGNILPAKASSKTQIHFHAESIIYEGPLVTLSGDVEILYNNQHILCNEAIINRDKQEINANGDLRLRSPNISILADSASINYHTETGTIVNGFVQSGPTIFYGEIINKIGPESYTTNQGYYTACTSCPPTWAFSGHRIQADIGEYAYIRYPIFHIYDFPVFFLPYIILPLKSDRQTGFLMPSFDFSEQHGFAFQYVNFFWAISSSQDATIGLKHYSKRGFKGLLNYRFVLSEESFGEFRAALLNDRRFAASQNPDPNRLRWFVSYKQLFELPGGFTQRSNINYISDLHYARDFPDEISSRGLPALESTLSLSKSTETIHGSAEVSYYLNQIKSDPFSSNRDAIHRWPEIRFDLRERRIRQTPFLFHLKTNYVNFVREDFAYDQILIENDKRIIQPDRGGEGVNIGEFQPENDLIRAGQRFQFEPVISHPLRIRNFDILSTAAFQYTQYALNLNSNNDNFQRTPARFYIQGRLSARTRFSRIFQGPESPPPKPNSWFTYDDLTLREYSRAASFTKFSYRHEIEPELSLTGVPFLIQTDDLFLGDNTKVPIFLDQQPISNSDLNSSSGLQFDYEDRLTNRNTAGLVINNRLIRRTDRGGQADYHQLASLRLAQNFDFDEARRSGDKRFPWSDLSALLDIRSRNFDTNTLLRYFPHHNKVNTSARIRFRDDSGNFLQSSFVQTFLITENIEQAYEGRSENIGFSVGMRRDYWTLSSGVNIEPISFSKLKWSTKSWFSDLMLRPPGDCWTMRVRFFQDIGGPLTYRFQFDYDFGGGVL